MASGTRFDPAHTVVLAMDCRAGLVSIYARPAEDFLARAVSAESAHA
jgi:hypothetical protein